ncbi:MAG TPA: hypothetical protein VMR41_06395 [Patescibacteria group bacterium]|nr:hypothetical protein [Patescibacteria group bacterium]
MNNLEDKHIEHLAKLQAVGIIGNPEINKWYGWGSPVGLIIFFNGAAIFAILIKILFIIK